MSHARLTALRLVGFKSFAERTTVEFGPGISAVVGPNGSGKSNLADALRWTLGEQGRSLRTRRSEDVIFAGSSTRRAIGMADVTLVIDNHDRLLPVDYGEVEIGRRLYRSGENEYLLNRQKIRLRDLVELLDEGNIADNAFLFIGQGMVDQALALRPEERRPLFEEAAGVRRHERRRRQAESELVEAEQNLDRLRDLLGELRPQARRLAAQAEQLQARRTAGVELAEALLAAARARWTEASETAAREQKLVDQARTAADEALAQLNEAESVATTVSGQIGEHAELERSQREVLDKRRAQIVELRVSLARLESESAALERDRTRLAAEASEAESRMATATKVLRQQRAEPDQGIANELALVERQLADIDATLGAAKTDTAEAARTGLARMRAERELHEGRAATSDQQARDHGARLTTLASQLADAEAARSAAVEVLKAAVEGQARTGVSLDEARIALERAQADHAAAAARLAEDESEAAATRTRLATIDAALDARGDGGLARAARARGGRLIGEGLEIDARFRQAVAAAIGDAATAYLVKEDDVPALSERRGTVALPPAISRRDPKLAQQAADIVAAASAAGGGALIDAVRRDPQGVVSAILGRVVWVGELPAALKLRRSLAPGWRVATLAGEVVAEDGLVELGADRSQLDLPDRRAAEEARMVELERQLESGRKEVARLATTTASRRDALREAQRAADAALTDQRKAAEAERVAQRRAEHLLRDHDWEKSRVDKQAAEGAAARSLVAQLDAEIGRLEGVISNAGSSKAADDTLRRATELRARRDQLRGAAADDAARIKQADEAVRRAEISLTIDQARQHELETESRRVRERDGDLAHRRRELATDLEAGQREEKVLAETLGRLVAAGADDRARLIAAERTAIDARERLRLSEGSRRDAEMRAMEARLQSDQLREQLLVELASIGSDGLAALVAMSGRTPAVQPADESGVEQMEALLDGLVARWKADKSAEPAPSTGKLATLRRRFHELGAGNPFAAEEYAELNDRLTSLETQRADMESAIDSTRELIASLSALINDQFRTTFAALEDAFARRFHELFGGGDAQLSLTAPDDLSVTGIEIHARPPGKKRQPLAMLSGGERALTAVSLLLAMLEVRPVPFCVLDEVDAALDEANVTRFSKALRGLSEQTQFIVITHNRGTIEGADALYGVTIGDDAVSRVISLRLPHGRDNGDASAELLAQAVN